jgi:hypothetical protein
MRLPIYKLKRTHTTLWIEVVDVVPHISLWRFSESTRLVRQFFVSSAATSESYWHNASLPLTSRI